MCRIFLFWAPGTWLDPEPAHSTCSLVVWQQELGGPGLPWSKRLEDSPDLGRDRQISMEPEI